MANKTEQLEQHPLALKLVPGNMPDEEFEAFCADLKQRGQRLPIVLFEGKVLDGMHRYRGCLRNGITPKFETYDGDDPAGLVISLNVQRRKLGHVQRALAGARLNLDYGVTQDDAAKRVGVSKVHVNLCVQALRSGNARIIKQLENPDLTRGQLHDDLVDCGIVPSSTPKSPIAASPPAPAGTLSAAAAGIGMADLFGTRDADAPDFLDGPPTGDADADTDSELEGVNLDGVLGTPPSANGKVISFPKGGTTEGGMPVIGDRPKHPERISRDTPASVLADRFKGLTEADQISFMQLTWPAQRRLLKTAGLSPDADMPPSTKPAAAGPGALGKPGKATTAQAAKAAQALATATIGKAASKPAKASKGKATAKVE